MLISKTDANEITQSMSSQSAREFGLAERRVRREFSANHPAKEKLVRHTLCRMNGTGRDIPWPNRPRIEQDFFSQTMGRPFSFSSYAYIHLCFDPDYRGWTQAAPPPKFSDSDRDSVFRLRNELAILAECHEAAVHDNNLQMLEILPFVLDFLEATCRCIMSIVEQRLILVSENSQSHF